MLQLYTTHHSDSYVFIYHRAFSNPDAELVAAGIDALHVAILDNLASRSTLAIPQFVSGMMCSTIYSKEKARK
jgi:hypothetical protein